MIISLLGKRFMSLAFASWAVVAVTPVLAQPTFTNQTSTWFPTALTSDYRSASLADIDNDSDLDLFLQGSTPRMYRNNFIGTGVSTFSNISLSGTGLGSSWSAAWGDYDGDHFIDVFVGQSNTGSGSSASGDVLRNNSGASFTNTSAATGLNDPAFHQNVAWSDIDNDRDLDLLIAMEGPDPNVHPKHEIYLQGPGTHFTPVGAATGFQADYGMKAYGMAIGDTDGDGDKDIYLSTCIGGGNIRNNFFQNMLVETGSLGFVDIADSNGTQFMQNSYNAEFHDLDDDGDLDLFMVGADRAPSKIWRNDGGNMFTDIDTITGHPLLDDPGGDLNGGRVLDYDNDGDLDLFMHDHLQIIDVGYTSDSARKLYRNDGNWEFTDVTVTEGLFNINQGAYDSTWGDIDNDGDQDLITTTENDGSESVFISNASTNGNHWLYINLAGPTENTTGIGAELYATINEGTPQERTLRREANTNAGTFNQSDLPVHFGLGAADLIDTLEIRWPDGTVQVLHDVPVDDYITINTPGDFNGDGKVNAADLAQWTGDFGDNDDSDANYDGFSDGVDFLAWQQAYGNGVLPSATAAGAEVPEPSTATLIAAAAGVFASIRRRSAA